MRFWESVKFAIGMQQKGIQPTTMAVERLGINAGIIKLDWKAIPEIVNDEVFIAEIVNDLLVERRVVYAPLEKENAEYSLQSIQEMHQLLNQYVKQFRGSGSEKDRLYAELLLSWKGTCKAAIQELQDAIKTEDEDRAAYKRWELLEGSDIRRAYEALPDILLSFRRNSYPTMFALCELLPDGHSVKAMASERLLCMKKMVMEHSNSTDDLLLEPDWVVSF